MTPSQAAKIIGVTPAQVRYLARTGKLQAERRLMPFDGADGKPHYVYVITRRDAKQYRDTRTIGRPRNP